MVGTSYLWICIIGIESIRKRFHVLIIKNGDDEDGDDILCWQVIIDHGDYGEDENEDDILICWQVIIDHDDGEDLTYSVGR